MTELAVGRRTRQLMHLEAVIEIDPDILIGPGDQVITQAKARHLGAARRVRNQVVVGDIAEIDKSADLTLVVPGAVRIDEQLGQAEGRSPELFAE